jgi:hypothetical protein
MRRISTGLSSNRETLSRDFGFGLRNKRRISYNFRRNWRAVKLVDWFGTLLLADYQSVKISTSDDYKIPFALRF